MRVNYRQGSGRPPLPFQAATGDDSALPQLPHPLLRHGLRRRWFPCRLHIQLSSEDESLDARCAARLPRRLEREPPGELRRLPEKVLRQAKGDRANFSNARCVATCTV